MFWAIAGLIGVPIGTILGYLLIRYLRKPEIRALFESEPQPDTSAGSQG